MLQKNVLKPFLYRFCWACHRSVSRHFPGPNLGDGHMPECRVCLISGAPPPSQTETPHPFKFLYKPLLQNVEGGGSKSVPSTNRSWTSQTAKLPYIFWVLSPTSWFLGISGGLRCPGEFLVAKGGDIMKLKKSCLIHRTFDSFKSVCIITNFCYWIEVDESIPKLPWFRAVLELHLRTSTAHRKPVDPHIKTWLMIVLSNLYIYIYIYTCNEATNSSCGHDFCIVWFDDSISYFVIPFFKFHITYEHWR